MSDAQIDCTGPAGRGRSTAESASVAGADAGGPHQRRRRRGLAIVLTVLGATGAIIGITRPFSPRSTQSTPTGGIQDNGHPTATSAVTRQDLSSQTEVPATLGYAGSYSIVNQAQGTVTALPMVGQVVTQGQVLYQVSGAPVALLSGSIPAYRALSSSLSGPDVAELNADLVALGYSTSTEIPSGTAAFTSWTELGVEKLQGALGVTENGTLGLGQVVFAPGTLRVTQVSATLGGPAQPGQPVLAGTSTTRQVSIALDATQQSQVAVGDKVTITLPDNHTTPGVIASVGTVASVPASGTSNSSPTITVLVTPTDPAATGTWDQAPVNVTITTGSITNVLVVPVDALLAQSGGADAVEVVGAHGAHHLVPVSLGLFDDADGLVQVSGSGLAAGQRVVVPKL